MNRQMPFRTRQHARILAPSLCLLLCAAGVQAQVQHGRVGVLQNDGNNFAASVTLTREGGSSLFQVRNADSNRGDYSFQFTNDLSTEFPLGVALSSIRQNGRDNGALPNLGGNTGARAGTVYSVVGTNPNREGVPGWSASVFSAPDNNEFNANIATAYFEFNDNFYGGFANNNTNNGDITSIVGGSRVRLGTEFIQTGTSGVYTLDITGYGESSQNGILLVNGAKNEGNFATSRANADGTFTIFCVNNSGAANQNPQTYENDPVSFVFVNQLTSAVVAGRVLGDASLQSAINTFAGTPAFTVSKVNSAAGTYLLQISGFNDTNGTLIVSSEGGGTNNQDNYVTYEYNAAANGWIIETERPFVRQQIVQNRIIAVVLDDLLANEGAFSFAYFSDTQVTFGNTPELPTAPLLGLGLLLFSVKKIRRARKSSAFSKSTPAS